MQIDQLLEEVKKEIKGGWTRGHFKIEANNKRGYKVCLVGACNEVSQRHDLPFRTENRMLELIYFCVNRATNGNIHSVTHYNDFLAKDKRDIISVVDCAIKEAKVEADG